ncbi:MULTISPECIES: inorganic diphosphatase [Fusobacterium]|uniref:inorganic diphosphatase n=1 Tax=Fusobacterium TaxID=848 RepID=UPI0025B8C438|nr:inorganic diphosphatase [Fusobacterium sp.]MCI5724491.1 inorganic pyrophosphatase [Fusobacterium sp.]MDY5306456.1 inorganic pyrophosphatase [Fusobacterium gastrosuis]
MILGKIVTVKVDRKLGSHHPEYPNIFYPINYGYIENVIAADGEEQDAYIMGVNEAVDTFTGKVIAIIHRKNDIETKWVVVPKNLNFTREEIILATNFQEQYFEIEIEI